MPNFETRQVVEHKTTSYTVADGDWGKLLTNKGAAGSVTFTLPAPTASMSGCWVEFYQVADDEMIIATATADTLVTKNDAAADSINWTTASHHIGNSVRCVTDGTLWYTIMSPSPTADGTAVSAYTITTA